MSEERQLKIMRLLENNPEMTQRELAGALHISLGAANFCLKALVDKGWIKIDNFKKNPNKLGYLYLVTPRGIAAKTRLTMQFLKRNAAGSRDISPSIFHVRLPLSLPFLL